MTANEYSDWLKTQLHGFEFVSSDSSQMQFARLVGGDGYRLHITLQPGTGTTHVQARLTVSPD